MWSTAAAGYAAGLSLIVAIGAQNAFVLRQGLRRHLVGVVVALCALSDVLLIVAGTLGIGGLVTRYPMALVVLRRLGAAYLTWFGLTALRAARHPQGLDESRRDVPSRRSVIATTLALTYLNPHVYLDTVVLLGSLANQHGSLRRWTFAAGACLASFTWFSALGFGARLLARPLNRPATWRIIDVFIGVTMLTLAVVLLRR